MLVQFSIKAQKPHCIQTCKCRLLQKKIAIVLQCDSKCKITLQLNCKTKNIILLFFSLNCLLTLPFSQHYLPRLSLSLLDFSLSLCSLSVISLSLPLLSLRPPLATIAQKHQAQATSHPATPSGID